MKVVLLGDSIRMGYGPTVEEKLRQEGHEVFQPSDNCRFIHYLLRAIFDYQEQIKDADVIVFNAGLWDICELFGDNEPFTPLEEYKAHLRKATKQLLKITPHVIFVTTTPVREGHPYNDNNVIALYNKEALQIMKELGVTINDLGGFISHDINKYIREDDLIHLSDEGIKQASKQILESIYNIK